MGCWPSELDGGGLTGPPPGTRPMRGLLLDPCSGCLSSCGADGSGCGGGIGAGASMGRGATLLIGAGFSTTAGGVSEVVGAFFATAFLEAAFFGTTISSVIFFVATFFTATFFTAFLAGAFLAGAFFAAALRAGFALLSTAGISKRSSVVFLLIRESFGKSEASFLPDGWRRGKR